MSHIKKIFDESGVNSETLTQLVKSSIWEEIREVNSQGIDAQLNYLTQRCGLTEQDILEKLGLNDDVVGFLSLAKKVYYANCKQLPKHALKALINNNAVCGQTLLMNDFELEMLDRVGYMARIAIKDVEIGLGITRPNYRAAPVSIEDPSYYLQKLERLRASLPSVNTIRKSKE